MDERFRQPFTEAVALVEHKTADQALSRLIHLADEGCIEALSFIGAIYEFGGANVLKDYELARRYYERSVDEFGAVEGYLGLIRIYLKGLGVEKDFFKVRGYAEKLRGATGNPLASFYLGLTFMHDRSGKENLEMARECFREAWGKGYVYGLTYLGIIEQKSGCYVKGFLMRAKAGLLAFFISSWRPNSERVRDF